MEKANDNTTITKDDLVFIKEELSQITSALTKTELATKLAYKKNASQLNQEVKAYDPECKYEVGDLICKEYNEPLTVSSKGAEMFSGTVVLKVINKIVLDGFDCELLEVDFTGGGTFRKHIDYMKKTKITVQLPSCTDGKARKPSLLEKNEDPRLNELPMTKKDLKLLEKNLSTAMSHSSEFFHWNDLWQTTDHLMDIPENTIKTITKDLQQNRESAPTDVLVSEFLKVDPADNMFNLHCLSLNYFLDKKYRKSFTFVSPENWGRWALKETLQSYLKNIPLAAKMAKLPEDFADTKVDFFAKEQFPLKVYLTWREVHSGGIQVPKMLIKELSRCREYTFIEADGDKKYPVYFFPNPGIFLGLDEFFKKNSVTQGASLTLEKKDDFSILFTLKKSKKQLSIPFVGYDTKKDIFSRTEEILTYSLPNKIIYLENETLAKLEQIYPEREKLDLKEVLVLIFKHFGLEGEKLSLHYHRAYHLVDMLRYTSLEDIVTILHLSPEFAPSEKKAGLFLFQEQDEAVEESILEISEAPQNIGDFPGPAIPFKKGEDLPEIGTVGEIETPKVILEEKIIKKPPVVKKPVKKEPAAKVVISPPQPAVEKPSKPAKPTPAAPKKEKPPKKKKHRLKPDVEKAPRRRKGEKRIIEERIELEESEMEALIAVKAEDQKEAEEIKIEVPELDVAEFITQDEPQAALSGLFGDKLKSALSQKKDNKQSDPVAAPKKKTKKTPASKAKKTEKK